MNPDVIEKLLDVLDASIARCETCRSGLAQTRRHISLLADELASTMPSGGKHTYMRAAMAHIAANPES